MRQDESFLVHIIAEICNYAVDHGMKPDDILSSFANIIQQLMDVSSFNGWRSGKE